MRIGKSKIFLFLCLSFLAGITLAKYLNFYLMAVAAIFFYRSPRSVPIHISSRLVGGISRF